MRPSIVQWSPHSSWICVTTFDAENSEGSVSFCDHTGINKEPGASRPSPITCLKWHPTKNLVLLGWKDGTINLVPLGGPISQTIQENGLGELVQVDWSHDGKLIMGLFAPGHVKIYSYDVAKSESSSSSSSLLSQVDLKEEITTCCKRLIFEKNPETSQDLSIFDNKMKNDVGNELEMTVTPQNVVSRPPAKAIGTEFLFGSESGTLFCVNLEENGVLHKLDSEILFLSYCEQIQTIIAFTRDLFIFHLQKSEKDDKKWHEKIKVKLGGASEKYRLELSDSILVMCYEERELRVWDLVREENGTISLDSAKGFDKSEILTCLTVNSRKGVISAGTSKGNMAHWKRRKNDMPIDRAWKLQAAHPTGDVINAIHWSPVTSSVAVITSQDLIIIQEDNFIVQMRGKVGAIQNSPTSFILLNAGTGVTQELKLQTIPSAKGISLGEKQLVVWNEDTIVTYDVQSSLATIQSTSFSCQTSGVVIANQTLFCMEKDKINARTLQGTIRQIISLPEIEGDPQILDLNKNWLAVGTSHGFVRIYNLARKDAHQEHNSKYAIENFPNFYKFLNVKISPNGSKVACTFLEGPTQVSETLLVFDAENDNITHFSFDRGMTDQQEYEAQAELAHTTGGRPVTAAARKMAKEKSRFQMMMHRPGEVEWDETDQRFLVVECNHLQPDSTDNRILTMFVTSEHGIQLQDIQQKSQQCGRLVSVSVPNFYFLKKTDWDEEEIRGEKTIGKVLVAKTLREFSGVEVSDEGTRKAMMDFSFYLTLGSMDAAFKAIQYIKSDSVWDQMASMSVKTRRLDVAMVCLGHMKNVRGSRSVRKTQQNGEDESMQCAALAIELGMIDEALMIYQQNDRWDLINKTYQAQGMWIQAFQIAETRDRIHLRNTHFNYARYLEAKKDENSIEEAIENYEKAGVHGFEVFRMLRDNPKAIENYVRRKREPTLFKWWGTYLESIGELEGAYNYYKFAQDFYSQVRVKCAQGQVEEAAKIANDSKDKAACYLIGRLYETEGDLVQAVKFFTKARALASAIRIARDNDMKDKLANLCLMAGGNELVMAARYYEDMPGYAHKSVMLYHKAGMIGRALDLAFRTEQFSALDLITKDLDAGTDPKILKRAAEFFENNQNYEKAVNFLCLAKDFPEAVRLCRSRNVRVTDKFAELMTPTKIEMPNDVERKRVLEGVAELCLQQGAYAAAAKKYTQAGDKLSAMRSLLKSGDIQKIRYYANTARNKEIYILAANFLQTTDWQNDAQTIKDIETFYTKSQSYEHLANFYKSCAFIEAENWKNFEKATNALDMSIHCLETADSKDKSTPAMEELKLEIQKYQAQLKKLIKIMGAMESDISDGIRQLTSLAETSDENDIVPCTKIYAMLIEEYFYKKNWKMAYRSLTSLQKKLPKIDLEMYINSETLDQICDEMRVERVTKKNGAKNGGDGAESDGEEVDFSHSMRRQNMI
ncbi:unnamed protein product [Caenorhabditis angaria]|uniref:Uncharacterized protein n=1 Tax=Caenorhabditis angaria TaxID=860376 RepID=A0A9P1IPU4_9PELO|nr:unnamed protein product [Caenorhabditis angaria]